MNTVFFDIDTQFDFLLPAGALYVPGAERIIPALSHLAKFAAAHSIPVISTADAHTENDPEFATWRPHCVAGTAGQQKPLTTLLSQSYVLPSTPVDTAEIEANSARSPQILIEKQHTDCFTNPNLKPLLDFLKPDLYVVYGVVTEICVQQAVLGLLSLGARVHVLTDAVRSLDQIKADAFFQTLRSQGGAITTVAEVTAGA